MKNKYLKDMDIEGDLQMLLEKKFFKFYTCKNEFPQLASYINIYI